jgi:DNA transformation protein
MAMAKAHAVIERVERHAAPLGIFRARAMFGGFGLYLDDVIFAIIVGDTLYLRVDEQTQPAYERAKAKPFVYIHSDGRPSTMPYWTVPKAVGAEPEEFTAWIEAAKQASLRAKAKKPKKTGKPKRPTKTARMRP